MSNFISNNIPQVFSNHLRYASSYEEALYLSYQSLFNDLIKSSIDITFSGSTAVTCFLRGKDLKVANSGDSRCIIGCHRNNLWGLKEITKDHKPNVETEEARIIESGGRVESYCTDYGEFLGPLRVWLKDENIPGLAMTRSIGDLVASTVGVSWEPGIIFRLTKLEVTKYTIHENDKFLIVASDGVWEFLDNKQVTKIIAIYYMRNDIEGACDELMNQA